MKNVKPKLQVIVNRIELKIEGREAVHENRSEKWQTSEKGELHAEKTCNLQYVMDYIDLAIEEMEEFES